jgi:hypothetical protein
MAPRLHPATRGRGRALHTDHGHGCVVRGNPAAVLLSQRARARRARARRSKALLHTPPLRDLVPTKVERRLSPPQGLSFEPGPGDAAVPLPRWSRMMLGYPRPDPRRGRREIRILLAACLLLLGAAGVSLVTIFAI